MLHKYYDYAHIDELIARLRGCRHEPSYLNPDKKSTSGFNMSMFAFPCGSPACIAGHCADLMGADLEADIVDSGRLALYVKSGYIAQYLDVGPRLADDIYDGGVFEGLLEDVAPEDAIEFLEELKLDTLTAIANAVRPAAFAD